MFLKSKASAMFPRRPSSSRENPSLSRRRKLVGAETLHSLIKYLKSRCEIRAFTFELSQQRYFNTTVNVLRTLEYSPGYSRHSRTSRNPFFLYILRRSSDLFTLRLINHLNEEPTGGFEPLMAARGQRSLICAAESRH